MSQIFSSRFQIQGFDSGINTARSQAATAAAGVDDIKALLDKLHAKNNETLASVSASRKDSEELRAQLAALNSTLAARVDALQSKVDELQVSVALYRIDFLPYLRCTCEPLLNY